MPGFLAARPTLLGVFLILGSAFSFSIAGVLIRWIEEAGGWQIVFYRSLALSLTLLVFLALRYRRGIVTAFTAPGWGAAVGTVCMALAQVCVIWAFLHTKVANVVFVFGALPFVSGVLAWLLLREPIRGATWMAMCLAFGGIALMTADELGAGRYLGNLLAIATTLFYGGLVVTARVSRASDMAPVLCSGALLACVICALLVEGFAIGWWDFLLCAVMGGVQTFFSYWLMTLAARYIRAAELTLLGSAELILGPLWVWLAVNETPTAATVMGGVVIMAAIAVQAFATARARDIAPAGPRDGGRR
ncbi:MAG: DMT family transporter [Alphaproteobacteria bacterium]|nr:DMT family transporter [Alphaproteobacteria bacterium]